MQLETTDFAFSAATWRTGQNTPVVFDCDPFDMISSTKPEVHNTLYYRHSSEKDRATVTGTENLVKFGGVVFEIYESR